MPDASGRIKGIAVPSLPWLCNVEYHTLHAAEYAERVKIRTCVLPRDHDGEHSDHSAATQMVHTTIHLVGGPLDGIVGDSPYAGSYVLWFRTHAGGPTDLAHGRRPRTGAIAYHRAGQAGDPLRYVRGTRHGRARLR